VRQAQAAFAQGDSKRANAIVQELASPTSPSLTLVPEALDRSRYEQSVLDVLKSNLPADWRVELEKTAADYRFDAYLVSPSGVGIVTEIFVTTKFTGEQLGRSIEKAVSHRELRIDGVLVVSRHDTAALRSLREKLDGLRRPSQVIAWSAEDSSEALRAAFAELVGAIGRST
jgi:hypothetical protein